MNEKCVVCEGYCPSTGCHGRPGYVMTGVGWVTYEQAVVIEQHHGRVMWDDVWSYSRYGITPEKDRIVIVDTETTELDTDIAEMIEIAWAEPGQRISSAVVEHSTHYADPEALRINRYNERNLGNPDLWAPKHHNLVDIVRAALEGATILGSFVDYDRAIISRWAGLQGYLPPTWHHRPLEIGSYVAGVYRLGRSLSLADAQALVASATGTYLDVPDHTAGGDVRAIASTWFAVNGPDPQ